MRAIAALSVVAYHVGFFSRANEDGWTGALLSRLNVGVTVFFLISGFVLYRPMVRARWEGEPPRPLGRLRAQPGAADRPGVLARR